MFECKNRWKFRINPVFVGRYSLLAVITDYDSWYAAKVVESMVVDLDPLRLSG